MTVPGVGPVVAVIFKSAVDDPSRITKSKAVGALFGLTPTKYQSGEKDVTGGITRAGDEMVRMSLLSDDISDLDRGAHIAAARAQIDRFRPVPNVRLSPARGGLKQTWRRGTVLLRFGRASLSNSDVSSALLKEIGWSSGA